VRNIEAKKVNGDRGLLRETMAAATSGRVAQVAGIAAEPDARCRQTQHGAIASGQSDALIFDQLPLELADVLCRSRRWQLRARPASSSLTAPLQQDISGHEPYRPGEPDLDVHVA
jgi:hypothetical protein